jgi:hypothetical protein
MLHQKSKRATTYHQRPNALSALDIHTMMFYQRFQALCGMSAARDIFLMILELKNYDIILTLFKFAFS